MSRVAREIQYQATTTENYIVCDACGKEEVDFQRAVDDTRWLAVRYVPPMSSMTSGRIIGEYCSIDCLYDVVTNDRLISERIDAAAGWTVTP